MQGSNLFHAVGAGEGNTERTVDTHVRRGQRTENPLHQFARSAGKDMPADMAVAHMDDAHRIGRGAEAQQAKFLPKGIEHTDAVRQAIFAHFPEGRRKGDKRHRHRVRALPAGEKRIAIRRRKLRTKRFRNLVLRSQGGSRQPQEQKQEAKAPYPTLLHKPSSCHTVLYRKPVLHTAVRPSAFLRGS